MILLDFSGTIFAALHADLKETGEPTFPYIQHLILNMVRSYNVKFKHEYGDLVICYDSHSWRLDEFPEYKWVRKNAKDDSDLDWNKIMGFFKQIQSDVTNNFPYKTIQVHGAEGDDIIAVMARMTSATQEKTLIISNDKDLVPCTKQPNVYMYRPYSKSMFSVDDPKRFEFELIVSGDKADGIPNIKCDDDFYKQQHLDKEAGIKSKRAPSITQKLKDELWELYNKNLLRDRLEELELTKNYLRNWKLIKIDNQPVKLFNDIIEVSKTPIIGSNGSVLKYLTTNKMYLLASHAADFYTRGK